MHEAGLPGKQALVLHGGIARATRLGDRRNGEAAASSAKVISLGLAGLIVEATAILRDRLARASHARPLPLQCPAEAGGANRGQLGVAHCSHLLDLLDKVRASVGDVGRLVVEARVGELALVDRIAAADIDRRNLAVRLRAGVLELRDRVERPAADLARRLSIIGVVWCGRCQCQRQQSAP